MKHLFISIIFLASAFFAKTQNNAEEVVKRVADNIIRSTNFRFVNNKTNEKFESTKNRDTSNHVKAESKFNKWQYVNGVLTVGMLRLSDVTKDQKYADYSRKNFSFIFDNLDYFKKNI